MAERPIESVATEIAPHGADAIARAARLIGAGQPVAVPTETVYGLAADARNAEAVARIYAAKGRPDFNPLIVHVPDLEAAERLGAFGAAERALAEAFRSEEHTSALQSLMRTSSAVFCLKKKERKR